MKTSLLLQLAVLLTAAAPAALLAVLAVPSLLRRPWREPTTNAVTGFALLVAFASAVVALLVYGLRGASPQVLSYGTWFSAGEGGFAVDMLVDGWSLGFAVLATGMCVVVAAFSRRYLHREPGHHRYFVLIALFVLGLVFVALAGSIEVLFAGWELLGLSSALLVAFFHEREAPVANALRVFTVYRISDAAMLAATVLLHYWAGSGSLLGLFSGLGAAAPALDVGRATVIAVLLVAAVAGKSALLPFSGWLPRAMEGPTPSSAVYYGALSIHAGCWLLWRWEPLLAFSPPARILAGVAGLATAVYATLCARAQPDVKSTLAYASLTQVGIIVVELALGWRTLAFIHLVGHACFRLLQFLSAPNLLHDLHQLEADLVGERSTASAPVSRSSRRSAPSLYLWALEGGFVDGLADRLLIDPFRVVASTLDRLDRRLCGVADSGMSPQDEQEQR